MYWSQAHGAWIIHVFCVNIFSTNTCIIHDVWRLLILSNEEKTNDYENFEKGMIYMKIFKKRGVVEKRGEEETKSMPHAPVYVTLVLVVSLFNNKKWGFVMLYLNFMKKTRMFFKCLMGFTYPIPDRWRMCTISYSIRRWRTAISAEARIWSTPKCIDKRSKNWIDWKVHVTPKTQAYDLCSLRVTFNIIVFVECPSCPDWKYNIIKIGIIHRFSRLVTLLFHKWLHVRLNHKDACI